MLRQFMTLVWLLPALSFAQAGTKNCCNAKAAATTKIKRQPSSANASKHQSTKLDFIAYMNANASHPALARNRALPQEAFKDWSKPAVISGSSLDIESDSGTRAPANTGSSNSSSTPPTAPAPQPDNR